MESDVNIRFKKSVKIKMNKLFKLVLLLIEQQSKKYEVNPKFFAKHPKGKEEGFSLIRKALLDNGNDLVRFIELIIDEAIITPKKSIVEIKDES